MSLKTCVHVYILSPLSGDLQFRIHEHRASLIIALGSNHEMQQGEVIYQLKGISCAQSGVEDYCWAGGRSIDTGKGIVLCGGSLLAVIATDSELPIQFYLTEGNHSGHTALSNRVRWLYRSFKDRSFSGPLLMTPNYTVELWAKRNGTRGQRAKAGRGTVVANHNRALLQQPYIVPFPDRLKTTRSFSHYKSWISWLVGFYPGINHLALWRGW